jgi:nitrite reductase (NADH) small subunit
MTASPAPRWTSICPYSLLIPERGVASILDNTQVAVFRTFDGSVFAIGNIDPFTGAAVLSRGIVGSRGDVPTVASPLHKQVFDLGTGQCLDAPGVSVPVFAVRVHNGQVEIGMP